MLETLGVVRSLNSEVGVCMVCGEVGVGCWLLRGCVLSSVGGTCWLWWYFFLLVRDSLSVVVVLGICPLALGSGTCGVNSV